MPRITHQRSYSIHAESFWIRTSPNRASKRKVLLTGCTPNSAHEQQQRWRPVSLEGTLLSQALCKKVAKLLDVTCCVRLHTPLHVVASCLELLCKVWNWSNFSYVQTDATTPNIVGNCRPTILRLLTRGFKSLINEICKFLHRICFTVSLLIPQGHIPLKCNKLPRHLNDENLPQDQEQRCKGLRFFCRESGFRRKRCQASLQVVSIRLHLKWN